jgi:hypothetical protein
MHALALTVSLTLAAAGTVPTVSLKNAAVSGLRVRFAKLTTAQRQRFHT